MLSRPCVSVDERFDAVGDPFDRPAQPFGGPQHQHVLGIEEQLHAEAAADIRRHHPDAVLRHVEDLLGEQVAQEMRALRRAPQRVSILARVVLADRAARLHRVDDDAVVDEGQRHAVPRAAAARSTAARSPISQSKQRLPGVRPTPRAGPDRARRRSRPPPAAARNRPRPVRRRRAPAAAVSATTIATVSPTCRTRSLRRSPAAAAPASSSRRGWSAR